MKFITVLFILAVSTIALSQPMPNGHLTSSPINGDMVAKLIKLVKSFKLEQCVARVICDLSCKPETFGREGRRLLKTMVAIQTSGKVAREDMKYYFNAGVYGRKSKASSNCGRCNDEFVCPAESNDMVALAPILKLDS